VNYRAGKGGQHLQGTYSHLDLDEMASWNDAVFLLGSRKAYLDVKLEALAGADDDETEGETASDSKTVHRLTLELATEALPKATENVLKLIEGGGDALGYHSTTLHRIEKGVGILGGLVANNPHFQSQNPSAPMTKKKMGMCHPDFKMATSPTAMDVSKEHLVLNHLQGVVTMLQPRIGEIDSRFLLLSHDAPHLDGVSVAIGRLADDESLQAVKTWESSLITSHGVPTNATLRIVGSGLLEEEEEASAEITPEESASSEDAKKQQTTSQ
jgi:cyclophilin family peptidyl-prolyl cis-trans isomerase